MALYDKRSVIEKVIHVQHGFKDMQQAAREIIDSNAPDNSFEITKDLFSSESYQVRMVAVFIFGFLASVLPEALSFLRKTVSKDTSWQVQEVLAQAFNEFCRTKGYEGALPEIKSWLADSYPNVKRAVSEGLRIWNRRPNLKEHPDIAIKLLSEWKGHESEYLRRSVGNALRDISRSEKSLIQQELASWDLNDPKVRFTYGLASKFL